MLLSMLYMAIKVLLATAASSHCLLSFLALVAQPVGIGRYRGAHGNREGAIPLNASGHAGLYLSVARTMGKSHG